LPFVGRELSLQKLYGASKTVIARRHICVVKGAAITLGKLPRAVALSVRQAVALGQWFGEMSDAERPTVVLS
jgi:hypothetical protein